MTDQVNTPEAGEQPQETTPAVENAELELSQGSEQQEQTEQQPPAQQKVVPLAALHEERARVKELREKQRMMEERFTQLQHVVSQRLTPQEQKQPEIQVPDVNADPVGHFRAENERLRQQLEQIGRPVQEIQQRMAQQEQYQRLQMHVNGQISEFAKEKADVNEAIQHARMADFQALRALGYDEATAGQIITQQYDQMVVGLVQQGRNVGEALYAFAQSKGYAPRQAQPNAQDKLQATAKVAGAARSLGSGGGVGNKLSLSSLAEMPADEFAKTIGDESAWRKLWGG
jgi:Holliday junction resolvasome RuvABC DNA-binding subunit